MELLSLINPITGTEELENLVKDTQLSAGVIAVICVGIALLVIKNISSNPTFKSRLWYILIGVLPTIFFWSFCHFYVNSFIQGEDGAMMIQSYSTDTRICCFMFLGIYLILGLGLIFALGKAKISTNYNSFFGKN